MKKISLTLFFLLLTVSFSFAKVLTVTYNWSRLQSHGSNQMAVWLEDTKGKHISTLFVTQWGAKGGYLKRPLALSEWTVKFGLPNATKAEVDAISGATPQTGPQTLVWNGKDKKGKVVPPGTYVVRMEANIKDADKMFFRAEVKIGGKNQETKGAITFTRPELASGNVLFKDVLVQYK